MPRDFFPAGEIDLSTWAGTLSQAINLAPAAYGLSVQQSEGFTNLYANFADALRIAGDPGTRTSVSVERKNAAKSAMIQALRTVVRIIQATPAVTNEQRINLGLPVRQPGTRPAVAPSGAPWLTVRSVNGRTVNLRIGHADSNSSLRAAGVRGAILYAYVGPTPAADPAAWSMVDKTTRLTTSVTFDGPLPPGTPVWLTARWYNSRGQTSGSTNPVQAHLGFAMIKPLGVRTAA